jgi:hypothetical protein
MIRRQRGNAVLGHLRPFVNPSSQTFDLVVRKTTSFWRHDQVRVVSANKLDQRALVAIAWDNRRFGEVSASQHFASQVDSKIAFLLSWTMTFKTILLQNRLDVPLIVDRFLVGGASHVAGTVHDSRENKRGHETHCESPQARICEFGSVIDFNSIHFGVTTEGW